MERRREAVWRDLGLEALVNGQGQGGDPGGAGGGASGASAAGVGSGPAATLRSGAGGGASAGSAAVRVRSMGRRMGGRRVITMR